VRKTEWNKQTTQAKVGIKNSALRRTVEKNGTQIQRQKQSTWKYEDKNNEKVRIKVNNRNTKNQNNMKVNKWRGQITK
jgi:hypothetical protein